MFWHSPLRRTKGFTLPELVIIAVVAVILASIALPSFLAWYKARQVSAAITELEGALKESQREAMRRNTNCTVTVTAGTNPTITASPSGCLPTGPRRLENVTLRRPNTLSTVLFSLQGRLRSTATGTAVVASTDNPSLQRCLVIAPGLGMMRVGIYNASDTTGNSAANCTTTQLN